MDPISTSVLTLAAARGAASALGSSLTRGLLPKLTDPWSLFRFRQEFPTQLSEVGITGAQREHLMRLFQNNSLLGQLSNLKTPQEVHAAVSGQMVGYLTSERILVTKAIFTTINIVIQATSGDRLIAGMILDLYLSQNWPEYSNLVEAARRRIERPGADALQELQKLLMAAGQLNAQLQVSGNGNMSLTGPVRLNMNLSETHALQMHQWLQGGSLGTLLLDPQEGRTRLSLGGAELDALMGMDGDPSRRMLAIAAQPEEREAKVEIRVAADRVRFTKCQVLAERAEQRLTFTFGDPDLFSLALTIGEDQSMVRFHVDLGTNPLPSSYRGLLRDLLMLCEPGMRLLISGRPDPIVSDQQLWGEDVSLRDSVLRAATYHQM